MATPYMNLSLPTVSATIGPTYATMNNAAFTAIDSHNHTSGQGLQVPASGININADLPHGGFNATGLRTTRFNDQGSALSGLNDAGCVYIAGGNLYYNNGAGTAIQLTAGAGLNAASVGGFGGDYGTSTASAFYTSASKLFSFQSATAPATWAALSIGSLTINDVTAGVTKGVKLQSPVGLANAYTLTLPGALPASSSVVSIDSSGIVSTGIAIIRAQLAAVGQQISSVGTNDPVVNGSWVNMSPSVTVTLVTTGRPVILIIQGGDPANPGYFDINTGATLQIRIFRDGATVTGYWSTVASGASITLPAALFFVDVPTAASHTYVLQAFGSGAGCGVTKAQLVAYEL